MKREEQDEQRRLRAVSAKPTDYDEDDDDAGERDWKRERDMRAAQERWIMEHAYRETDPSPDDKLVD